MAKTVSSVLILACLAACAQRVDGLPPAPLEPEPEPVSAAPSSNNPVAEYRLQPGDILAVRLLNAPELDEEMTVQPDGRVATTIAQAVPASGRTIQAVADDLRERYGHELRAPKLTLVLRSAVPTRVYVAGEVNNPGEFVAEGPTLTVLQAMARAGGPKLSADTQRLFILRHGPGAASHVFAVDFHGAASAASPDADVRLAPYDVLYVPRTGIYELFTYWNQYLQQFVPVSWGFSYDIAPQISTTRP